MRLSDGSLWPIPITLDVSDEFISKIKSSKKITLRDKEGFALAILNIDDIWKPDFQKESFHVFGTTDQKHPGVNYLLTFAKKIILVEVFKKYHIQFIMITNLYAMILSQ